MPESVEFFFDFASPYSYFVAAEIDARLARHGRTVVWRPIILWAVLREHGLPAPLEHPVKKAYLLDDMKRSADFHGLPFRVPSKFPTSSHLPARAFYWLQANANEASRIFARRVFESYFDANADIGDAVTVAAILCEASGVSEQAARAVLSDVSAKEALQASVNAAVARGVWGVPYIVIDGEAFFGADRLPQIEHRLAESRSR